ncbi:DUF2789 domain-containing protein [Simiduia aestuariiviva]|uniref:DUF2789 domain-containing protein n=1 Tax=Simiduia aestuariiviva TaxID=1510459 RepID=A0A839ULC2_9GAMM|nr:DUF2789 domain-containing protein [Simiduia aestuariiviva]MBB3168964.1 hypothetical protein [Simiduia aestuariiviva]
MDLHHTHNVKDLFQQLGLEDGDAAVERFIASHRLRPEDGELYRAIFWSPSQAKFIKESIEEDAEWAEAVDQLDARLRS